MSNVNDNLFSSWEHLQTVLLQTYNKDVRKEFADIEDDDDYTTPRSSLKAACLMKDKDSAPITLVRMLLFYGTLRGMRDFWPSFYGIPATDFQISRVYLPQIQLYFQEHPSEVESDYAPITGEISFRVMNETAQSLTEADLRIIANKIKTVFGGSTPYRWRKGKLLFAYTEKKKGYQLQLNCISEAEAKDLIRAVLSIQNDTPDWKFLNINQASSPADKYPTVPPREIVVGKSRRMPRKRPVGTVRFCNAVCHVYGLPNPIVLHDVVGTYKKALVQ